MLTLRISKICVAIVCTILGISTSSEAEERRYFFHGDDLVKLDQNGQKTSYCKGSFNLEQLGFSLEATSNLDLYIPVSANEKYFVFKGLANRLDEGRYFLADIAMCRVVRELTPGKPGQVVNHMMAFSPNSERLFVTFIMFEETKEGKLLDFRITKEYSGPNFANERILKNIELPASAIGFKFSSDGRFLLKQTSPRKVSVGNIRGTVFDGWIVYDLNHDEEVFTMHNWTDYFGHRRLIKGEEPPDISDGALLFNFEADHGAEINIFDYRNSKIERKIAVPEKGTGRFSSDGEKVIVSTLPDPKNMKKDVIVFERKTGKRIGRVSLDAADEVADVSADRKEIILINGKHAMVEH